MAGLPLVAATAVARARCDEVFNPPGCITLWKLPTETEDAFETRWQEWLDEPEPWTAFFDRINAAPTGVITEIRCSSRLSSAG